MAYRQYTQCYQHTPGDKPFNIANLAGTVFGGGAAGLVVALVGAIVGSFFIAGIGAALAVITGIITVADQWLYHRLVCLTGVKCAVGKVRANPSDGGLGNFDNDQYFNVVLLPHIRAKESDDPTQQAAYTAEYEQWLAQYPANKVPDDGLMGEELLKPILTDLPFGHDKDEATELHCEAEGDFWIKMKEWAAVIAIVVAGVTTGAVAAGIAGAAAGAGAGCAALSWLGPIGCLIGAIVGAIIGGALAGGTVAAIGVAALYGILYALFNANMGNVEDANVGDTSLGPIRQGDRVIVVGQHVYDGFHEGWHEFHPLMAVMKLNERESSEYLEWKPDFDPAVDAVPDDANPAIPAAARGLTADDMRQGLNSPRFAARAAWLRDRWCGRTSTAFDPETIKTQQSEEHRWTIHPAVDGCGGR